MNLPITTRSDEEETVRTIIVRDGTIYEEKVEIRRVFVHPGFKFPSLYDDIAVAELGTLIVIFQSVCLYYLNITMACLSNDITITTFCREKN